MNLKELKQNIDFQISNLYSYQNLEQINVLINLSENSIGSRAATAIKYIGMGIDWESGQLRIEPEKHLVSKGNAINDSKNKMVQTIEGRKYYFCSRCEEKISKGDHYCRNCGQKLN